MELWTTPHDAPAPPASRGPEVAYYVPLPRRLAEDLRDAPAAVGAYALLARLFRASGQPVPLSPADLQVYDPALSYGAATRALQRLAAAGWLAARRRPGHKTTYAPTWGSVRGGPCAWDLAAPCLGRPRHILALRLDQRLLDVCMGRLVTHPAHPALARRYLLAPLLGLREVGAYALALAGLPAASPALDRLGLLADGRPLPLPDEATILAVASQRAALSPEGWRRTPFGADELPASDEPCAQALFFVPPGQIAGSIGPVIADPITPGAPHQPPPAASGRPAAPAPQAAPGSHGSKNLQGEIPTTPAPAAPPASGGGRSPHRPAGRAAPPREQAGQECDAPPPTGESARLLLGAGVRRSVAAALADRPASQVARLIGQARARPDVRDLAGWVVAALRDLPADDAPPAPERPLSALPIHTHPGLSDEQRDRWIRRFRAVATPAEQRAILQRLEQEHPL